MLATYHNHSTHSDGKAAIRQIIDAAASMGVGELGLSDHLTLHPSGRAPSWSMPPARLPAYLDELLAARDTSKPVIRIGLEVDWFPGRAAVIADTLRDLPLDFVIGSVHFIGEFVVDTSAQAWRKLTQDQVDDIHRRYWIEVRHMAQSGLFDIAAHLDLPRKFGFHPRMNLSRQIGGALDAIAAAGMVVELNTAGWHKPCNDAYPTLDILRQCRGRGIEVTLSSDSHQPEHLVRDFARGAERLAAAGYDRVTRFESRQARFEPLREAF